MTFETTDRNQVKRIPNRGHYDREAIHRILNAGFLCHIGFVVDEQPFVISEQVLKGRWDEARPPVAKELKATTVLRLDIESASAKIRTGPPSDEEDDYALPIWAGVVPIEQAYRMAEPDARLAADIAVPQSILSLLGNSD